MKNSHKLAYNWNLNIHHAWLTKPKCNAKISSQDSALVWDINEGYPYAILKAQFRIIINKLNTYQAEVLPQQIFTDNNKKQLEILVLNLYDRVLVTVKDTGST